METLEEQVKDVEFIHFVNENPEYVENLTTEEIKRLYDLKTYQQEVQENFM